MPHLENKLAEIENAPAIVRFRRLLEMKKFADAAKLLKIEQFRQQLLEPHPDCRRNIVHLAAEIGDTTIFLLVIEFVKENPALLNAPCEKGWLPLHYAARHNSAAVVQILLKALGEKTAVAAAKAVTNEGKRPLEYYNLNPHSQEKAKIFTLLAEQMEKNPDKFPKLLKTEAVLTEYKSICENDSELKNALTTVVTAMNKTPTLKSSTSPFVPENKDPITRERLRNKIEKKRQEVELMIKLAREKMRSACLDLERKEVKQDTVEKFIRLHEEMLASNIEKQYEMTVQAGIGACREQAVNLVRTLHQEDPSLYAYAVYVRMGDHALVKAITKSRAEIYGDTTTSAFALQHDYPFKVQYYANFIADQANLNLVIYGPLNLNFHALLLWRQYGHPVSYTSNVRLLVQFNPTERKQFLVQKHNRNKNELHFVAQYGEPLRLKIYFKFIHEMQDPEFTKQLLAAVDSYDRTPLHFMANNQDDQSRALLIEEYKKLFNPAELFILLFGKEKNNLMFFVQAAISDNDLAVVELQQLFPDKKDVLIKMQQTLLLKLIAGDDKELTNKLKKQNLEKLIGFFAKHNELITDEIIAATKKAFLATKPLLEDGASNPIHLALWGILERRLEEDDRVAIIEQHDEYNKIFKLFHELDDIRKNPELFPDEFWENSTVKALFENLPQQLIFDDKLKPNRPLVFLEGMKKVLVDIRLNMAAEQEDENTSVDEDHSLTHMRGLP